MKDITRIIEVKKGNKWEIERTITDTAAIYESLACDLVAKKLHGCTWITRVNDVCNYDGTRTITVTYNNGCRSRYTIKA